MNHSIEKLTAAVERNSQRLDRLVSAIENLRASIDRSTDGDARHKRMVAVLSSERITVRQAQRLLAARGIESSEKTIRRRCDENGIDQRKISTLDLDRLASAITHKNTRPDAKTFLKKVS